MNKNLVKFYVAHKAAHKIPELKALQEELSKDGFVAAVMSRPLTDLPEALQGDILSVVQKRFNVTPHPMLFRRPTIGQWVSDICRDYSVDDILAFFCSYFEVPVEALKKIQFGSLVLLRDCQEALLHRLEESTGRTLGFVEESEAYNYLEDVTFDEIAHFFATDSVAVARKRWCHCEQSQKRSVFYRDQLTELIKHHALALYRLYADIPKEMDDETVLTEPIANFYPAYYHANSWDLPVYYTAGALGLGQPVVGLVPSLTVKQLIDQLVKIKIGR